MLKYIDYKTHRKRAFLLNHLYLSGAKDKKNKNSKTLTSPEEETSTDDEQDTKL